MNLKNTLLGVALAAATLLPAAAFAGDRHGDRYGDDDWYRHNPRPAARAGGHYEVRTIQQWVDGRWVQDYVPEQCFTQHKRKKHKHVERTVCQPARYENRWVPGHYENVNQWVWVPAPRPAHQHYGHHGHRDHGHPGASVTVNGGNWQASARF